MPITQLPAAGRVEVPWRNGGGTTQEIACHPPGAGFDAFTWRVSMAQVDQAGPFSHFPGVDRVLTILAGSMALEIAGAAPVTLTAHAPPHAFPGDAPCTGTPRAGTVTDLNVMTRRGHATAQVRRSAGGVWRLPTQACLVFALAPLAVGHAGASYGLLVYDALLLEGMAGVRIDVQGAGVLIAVQEILRKDFFF